MFTPDYLSFFDAVKAEEINEFIDGLNPSNIKQNKEDVVDGELVYQVSSSIKSIKNLLTRSRVVKKRELMPEEKPYPERLESGRLLNNVTSQLVTIATNCKVEDAIHLINKVKHGLGKNFYGALLIKGKTIINPLHPLMALRCLEDVTILGSKYRVVVYAYSDRKTMDEYYETSKADESIIEENLSSLIATTTHKIETEIRPITTSSLGSKGNIIVRYKTRKTEEDDSDDDNFIVANQIIADGIFAPFYGSTLIKMGNSVTGVNLTPMTTANVSPDSRYQNGRSFDSVIAPSEPNVVFNGICTGSRPQRTMHGLRSLTHSNLKSPLTREIDSCSLAYADACVEKSLEIYKIGGMLKISEEEQAKIDKEKQEEEEKKTKEEEERSKREERFKYLNGLSMEQFSNETQRLIDSEELTDEEKITLFDMMERR